eukprot:UN09183
MPCYNLLAEGTKETCQTLHRRVCRCDVKLCDVWHCLS